MALQFQQSSPNTHSISRSYTSITECHVLTSAPSRVGLDLFHFPAWTGLQNTAPLLEWVEAVAPTPRPTSEWERVTVPDSFPDSETEMDVVQPEETVLREWSGGGAGVNCTDERLVLT